VETEHDGTSAYRLRHTPRADRRTTRRVAQRETLLVCLYVASTKTRYGARMKLRNHTNGVSTTRRQVLMMSGTALLTSVAGCSAIREFTSDMALGEVNVFNMADRQIRGSIEVVGPAGDTALEETFELGYEQDQNSGDVLGATGEYAVSVELTNTEIAGRSQASKTVSIDDTDEQRVGVVVNTNDEYDPIVIRVGTTAKDFLEVAN
jgi:hypothetical protein